MSIDINRLSPWAQKQIAEKQAQQIREKAERQAAAQAESKRKYHNTPTQRASADGKTIKFDSKAEARRFDELLLLLQAGEIRDLKLQPQFTLQEAYTTTEGVRVRAIRYQADFEYEARTYTCIVEERTGMMHEDYSWQRVVEDVKGGKATKTRVYAMKKKLLHDRLGITVTEVE